MHIVTAHTRRQFLQALALGASSFSATGLYAEALAATPAQTEGPFYPDRLPVDTDNDPVRINDAITPAAGTVTWLGGRVLDARGDPVRNATIEIWQCDATGVYIHSRSGGDIPKRDTHFQGFGRFVTGRDGAYVFRTIKPVAYPGRTPHIHVAVKFRGEKKLVTQCYVKGDARNDTDGILRGIRDERARAAVVVPFTPLPGSAVGELTATFDLVLGFTPAMG